MRYKSLLIFVLMIFTGCGGEDTIQYPGAPTISIHPSPRAKASDWGVWFQPKGIDSIKYRLEAEQPLPYAISVLLLARIDGMRYTSGSYDGFPKPIIIRIEMLKGTTVRGEELNPASLFYVPTGAWITEVQLEILEWDGLGDAPYNIGRPFRLRMVGEW